jgi:hypothetical protein
MPMQGYDSVCAPSATVVQVIECHVDLDSARQEPGRGDSRPRGPQRPRRRPLSPRSGLVGWTARDFGPQGAQLT